MHSVGVGTFTGGYDFEVCSFEVLAVNDTNVEILAIQRCYASDVCFRHGNELEVLRKMKKKIMNAVNLKQNS